MHSRTMRLAVGLYASVPVGLLPGPLASNAAHRRRQRRHPLRPDVRPAVDAVPVSGRARLRTVAVDDLLDRFGDGLFAQYLGGV